MAVGLPLLPRWLRWTGVFAVASLIFYLSILTTPPAEPIVTKPDPLPLDKWRHFLAYAAFGLSLAYATTDWQASTRVLAVGVVGTTVLYGLGIEFGQLFLPNRYFSLGDAYANAIGGVLVLPWYLIRPSVSFTPVESWLRDRVP